MAGENRLKDARIKLVLDTSGAKVPEKTPGKPGPAPQPSTPGRPPPSSPGEEARQEQADREERRNRRRRRRSEAPGGAAAGAAVVGAARLPGLLLATIKTVASGAAVTTVAEYLPGIIEGRKQTLDSDQYLEKFIVSVVEEITGFTVGGIAELLKMVERNLPVFAAYTNTAGDVAIANKILGLGLSSEDILDVAGQQAGIATIGASLGIARREAARAAMGKAIVDAVDELKEKSFKPEDAQVTK